MPVHHAALKQFAHGRFSRRTALAGIAELPDMRDGEEALPLEFQQGGNALFIKQADDIRFVGFVPVLGFRHTIGVLGDNGLYAGNGFLKSH